MVKLFSIHLDKINTALPKLYHHVLNTFEQQQVNRLKIEKKRNQRIASRAILRLLLSQETNHDATSIQLFTSQYGKPFLKNKNLCFNVSHSNHMLVIALSNQYEVGIDIEYQPSNIQVKHMPKQCFHAQEWEYFQALSHHEQKNFFLNMWTAKEAISKALGLGFQLPFNHINTLETNKTIFINTKRVYLHDVPSPRNNYITSLATISSQAHPINSWQELQNEWINQCLI